MYDVPPEVGAEPKKKEVNINELSYKEQKALPLAEKLPFLKNAPRQAQARNMSGVRDKPFGQQVRNVRCLKCGQWGHQHVDRVCPLFGKAKIGVEGEAERASFEDPAVLMQRMRRDGLSLTRSVLGRQNDPTADNQQLVEEPSDAEEEDDVAFIASLSRADKKKLLRKLRREERRAKKRKHKERKHRRSTSDGDDAELHHFHPERRPDRHPARHHQRHTNNNSNNNNHHDQRGSIGVSPRLGAPASPSLPPPSLSLSPTPNSSSSSSSSRREGEEEERMERKFAAAVKRKKKKKKKKERKRHRKHKRRSH
ncbi:hypothetical protein PTSG_06944 [Salpingoeca rosetta]|uniref:Zinc knuckle domain-containing protein n=1 Tax=Salpingoeca rosetta (strain ATCC 50818 / BSB-021) TaxID=946362 RepID=F2UF92_SALR5|nr:uncharacterized protein PTSG_06944 [Salpingoeca rosetta]EGD75292.1 hypothetical protein PTSG_06944 [Salpingoeca rosetta]|eukprot:XP_004992345.1 hypothetical protein PTSG_06944 [Salpingoeca rosetta]